MRISCADPGAGFRAHRDEIERAVRRVLESGSYILGPEVEAFEAEFARYLGARHVVGVASGTDALTLALRACGIGPGDLVLTVSLTATATVAAIELAGATPLFVDVDPETFTMDPEHAESALRANARVRALLPVHLYGQPADMPALLRLAEQHRLILIEDCAQAHGALAGGKKAGTLGHAAAFSFYPTKNLGGLGDGGAVVTNDAGIAERLRLLRQYGWKERFVSEVRGTNSRLDELQAAILRVKLRSLDSENARRREIAGEYGRVLADTRLGLPRVRAGATHVYHQYVVRSKSRASLRTHLEEGGIGTGIHYPVPVHLQPAYAGRVPIAPGGLPHTEQACREILSLPMHPYLREEDVVRVTSRILEWERGHS